MQHANVYPNPLAPLRMELRKLAKKVTQLEEEVKLLQEQQDKKESDDNVSSLQEGQYFALND